MKKSFSKRVLALFLSVLMLATALPFSGLTSFAKQAISQSGGYLFAFFKDDGDGQKLYFGLSKDGYNFEELNGGEAIPLDYSQTVTQHIRDPFIFKAQDDDANGYKYYIIATDMNAAAEGGWDSTVNKQANVALWGTRNLSDGFEFVRNINMNDRSEGSLGKLMADKFGDIECIRFWAPEVIWDPTYITDATPNGAYLISFGYADANWSRGTRLYYTHTLDFKTFFDADKLFELRNSDIDANVIIDNIDSDIIEFKGDYYMFFKYERDDSIGTRVYVTKSKSGSPIGPYYEDVSAESDYVYQVSRNNAKTEGPMAYRIDGTDTFLVALDNFTTGTGSYELFETGDFKNFSKVSNNEYSFINSGNNARHASVCHITDEEYDALVLKYGKYTDTQTGIAVGEPNDHLVARYLVDTDPTKDVSGNGNDIVNGVNGEFANVEGKTIVKDGKLCVDFSGNANGVAASDNYIPTSNHFEQQYWKDGKEPDIAYSASDRHRRAVSRTNGTYLAFDTAELLKNTNINQGVSISFDAMAQSTGALHVIDIGNAKEFGYVNPGAHRVYNYDSNYVGINNGINHELNSNASAYNNSTGVYVQMDSSSNGTVRYLNNGGEGSTSFSTNPLEWHNYTITVTKGMLSVYVDGVKVQQDKNSRYNQDWFNALFMSTTVDNSKLLGKSKIGIGVSQWIGDYLFTGYISNVCLYDRCLSLTDIEESQEDLLQGDTISMSESRLIYQDLVTDEQFGKYSKVISDDMTNGYGKMLRLNGETIASAETVQDSEAAVSANGYSYNFWVYPNGDIEDAVIMRQGNEQQHFDIKENGVVEFKYGDNISFKSDELFKLEPNKIQNVTIEVIPYASYDRIIAYVNGEQTGFYDAYLAAADNNYPEKTLLSFINDTNAEVNANTQITYGDAAVNTTITGVTIYRGAVDGKELYLSKFSDLAESIYTYEFKEFEQKIAEFNTDEKFYKNMNNAYQAYDKVSRYVDAVEYGNQEADIDYLAGLVTELKLANDAMVPYEGVTNLPNNYNVRYSDGTNTYETSGTSVGMLFSDVVTPDSGATKDTYIMKGNNDINEAVLCNVLYADTVFLYDGKTDLFKMPVWFYGNRISTSKPRYMCSVFPCISATNNVQQDTFFVGENGIKSKWFGWNDGTFAFKTDGSREVGYDLANTGGSSTGLIGAKNFYFNNYLNIDTSKLADYADVNNTVGSVQGEYKLNWFAYGDSETTGLINKKPLNMTWASNSSQANNGVFISQPKSIFVLDVTQLDVSNENCPIQQKDPTNAVHGVVPNSSGLQLSYELSTNLLKAIDMYTSFDDTLAAEQAKNNVASALYANLASDISNAASNYDSAYSEVQKALHSVNGYKDTDYQNLKDELKDDAYLAKIDNIKDNQTIDGTETYTTDSCEAYINVYNEAVNHFASLDPRNEDGGQSYATEDGITSDTATNLLWDIREADAKLMPVADYSGVTDEYNNSLALELGTGVSADDANVVNQNYSIKTWLGLTDPQNTAKSYVLNAPEQDALYDTAAKANQPKYTVNEDGTVNRNETSVIQNDINSAQQNLADAVAALASPAAESVLEVYNAAQQLAERVDLEAYLPDAQAAINANLDLGYVSGDNTVKRAQDYTNGGVYVSYGDGIYIYGDDTDVENASKQVLTDINATYEGTSGKPVNMGGYKVTLNVYVDGTLAEEKPVKMYLYGNDIGNGVKIDASSYNDGSYDIAKWQVKSANAKSSTIIKETGFVIKREIQQDTIVDLYLTTKVENATKVSVVDYFGVQLDSAYVNLDGDTLNYETADDNSLVFTDANGRVHTVAVNTASQYSFNKWIAYKTADGMTVAQSGTKEANAEYGLYFAEGGTVNGVERTYVDFNTYVNFVSTTDSFFAWVKSVDGVNWYVASYDANFTTISAPTNTDYGIKYVAVSNDENAENYIGKYITNKVLLDDALSNKAPFSFGTATQTVNVNGVDKFRLYCDFSVNSNMSANIEVVQYGVLYTAADTEPVNFTKGADGIRTGAANACSDYSTYTMTLTPKPGSNTYMRSYVSYMYTKTNADGTTTKVPLVAYGPVVSCDANGNISK